MGTMKITYQPNRGYGTIYYNFTSDTPSCSDGITMESDDRRVMPMDITADSTGPYKQMELAHETGHILLGWRTGNKHTIKHIRVELLAWRIAKSILKKEYWHEGRARYCLSTYLKSTIPYGYDLSKIKIMPWDGEFKKKLKD